MIRINLLPHRDERRKASRRQLGVLAAGFAILGLVIAAAVHGVIAGYVSAQNERNDFLKAENAKLGQDEYRSAMAVAGFGERDLDITAHENVLTVKGQISEPEKGVEKAVFDGQDLFRAMEPLLRQQRGEHPCLGGAAVVQ